MNIIKGKMVIGQDFVKIGDDIFFSSANCNGLYKWKLGENEATFILGFPNEGELDNHLHAVCKLVNGKIYFAPAKANAIVTYDIEKNILKTIETDFFPGRHSKYYDICTYEDRVFIIPCRCEEIIEIDTNTDKAVHHSEWTIGLDLKRDSKHVVAKQGAFIRKGKLYIPFARCNSIIAIDINTYNSEVISVGNIKEGFVDAYYDDAKDEVWLLHNGVSVVEKYSFCSGNCKTIRLKDDSRNEYPYIKMLKLRESLLLIPYQDREFIKVSLREETFKITRVLPENMKKNQWEAFYYSASKASENEFIALAAGEEVWELYDDECNLIKKYRCVDESWIQRTGASNILVESNNMTLEHFLSLI